MINFIKVLKYGFFCVGGFIFMISNIFAINFSFEIKKEQLKNTKPGTPIIENNKTTRLYVHITKDNSEDVNSSLTLKNINTGEILKKNISFNLSRKFEDIVWVDFKLKEIGTQTIQTVLINNEDGSETLGSDTLRIISDIDSDLDGIFNTEDPDDDNDGLSDTIEINLGSSPTRKDSDGDSISDKDEFENKTNPVSKDSDGDGVHDNFDAFPLDPRIYLYPENNAESENNSQKNNSNKSSNKNNFEQNNYSNKDRINNKKLNKNNNFLLQASTFKNNSNNSNNNNNNNNNNNKQNNDSKNNFIKKYIIQNKDKIYLKDFLDISKLNLQEISWSINDSEINENKFKYLSLNLPFQRLEIKVFGLDENFNPKNFNFFIWIFHPYFFIFLIFIVSCFLFIFLGLFTRQFRERKKRKSK